MFHKVIKKSIFSYEKNHKFTSFYCQISLKKNVTQQQKISINCLNLSILNKTIKYSFNSIKIPKKQLIHSTKPSPTQISTQVQTTKPQYIDITDQPFHIQFSVLKQHILLMINNNQDTGQLLQCLNHFSDILVKNNQIRSALQEFQDLIKKMKEKKEFKSSPSMHFVLAEFRYFLIKVGRYQNALRVTQQAVELLKKNSKEQNIYIAHQLSVLGILSFQLKHFEKSKKAFEEQLKLNLNISDQTYLQVIQSRNNLAILDFYNGQYQEALNVFNKNAQISKRIIKSSSSSNNKLVNYLKHFVYLQAIYEWKRSKVLLGSQEQKLLKGKIFEQSLYIEQILKANTQKFNDMILFYQTIASSFLKQSQTQLSIKFIQKSINLSTKKIKQSFNQINEKQNKSLYQISNNLARQHKILAECYYKQKQYKKCMKEYESAIKRYKKQILANQSKQQLSIQNVYDFLECCKQMLLVNKITVMEKVNKNNDKKKAYQKTRGYLQIVLSLWNTSILNNIWRPPTYFNFIPTYLNLLLALTYLKQRNLLKSLNLFNSCITYLNQNCGKFQQKQKYLLNQILNILVQTKNQSDFQQESLQKINGKIDVDFKKQLQAIEECISNTCRKIKK